MNAAEQRAHRTVTQSLEQRIEALETLLLQVSKNCDWLKQKADQIDTRLHAMDTLLGTHEARFWRFAGMSFSARLRWLLLGR